MAAFTYTVGIMLNDLAHSLFIIMVLIAAFGSALSILEDAPFDQGLYGLYARVCVCVRALVCVCVCVCVCVYVCVCV